VLLGDRFPGIQERQCPLTADRLESGIPGAQIRYFTITITQNPARESGLVLQRRAKTAEPICPIGDGMPLLRAANDETASVSALSLHA
jgi:hypothetical protein